MKTSDFDFELPQDLIASTPSSRRGDDRLMHVQPRTQRFSHHHFSHIVDLIPSDALLVFNNSKVRKARLQATTENNSAVEFLLLQPLSNKRWLVLVSKAKRQKIGRRYSLLGGESAVIVAEGEAEGTKIVEFTNLDEAYLEQYGSMPLPPYMQRDALLLDDERYQTIYAKVLGSAAAPTAGLHFTDAVLAQLKAKGVEFAFATLHVGLGTFAPVRSEIITDHNIHHEYYSISQACADQINLAKASGRPVIAVGTTSCRLLESAAQHSANAKVSPGEATSSIFIYPGYKFKLIDGLITNFHTPKSTLLALVSALAGYDLIRASYQEAIEQGYRFFSYGDAMLIYEAASTQKH